VSDEKERLKKMRQESDQRKIAKVPERNEKSTGRSLTQLWMMI
jgi:hypothetical protein